MKSSVEDDFTLLVSFVEFVKLHDNEFDLVHLDNLVDLVWLRNSLVVSLMSSVVVDSTVTLSVDSTWLLGVSFILGGVTYEWLKVFISVSESAIVSIFANVELEILAFYCLEVVVIRGFAGRLRILDQRNLIGCLLK